jgi:hypothetical protein
MTTPSMTLLSCPLLRPDVRHASVMEQLEGFFVINGRSLIAILSCIHSPETYSLACLISCGAAATSGRNLHDKLGLL